MTRLQADERIAQMELQEVLRQDSPKAGDVKARVAAVNKIRSQILEQSVDFQVKVKQVLTPEQRKKLQSMQNDRRGPGRRGGAFRGRGRGEGRRPFYQGRRGRGFQRSRPAPRPEGGGPQE